MMSVRAVVAVAGPMMIVLACSAATQRPADGAAAASAAQAVTETATVPAGFGTLRQDDIALALQRFSVQVRAIPLDESVIRLLSPDSYRSLHGLRIGERRRLEALQRRYPAGGRELSVWYVTFFSVEPGEARYSPMEVTVTNVGRDFRPIDVVPLTPGFGEQRLRQRESQSALLVFEGQLDVGQPLTLTYETATNVEWAAILQRLERERVAVRARAAAGRR
jgi:hypothetical protein